MEVPPGFGLQNKEENVVCQSRKALYGLKQSLRAWFGRFTRVMLGLGYKQCQGDHTFFIHHLVIGKLTVLLVYVDDIIVIGDDMEGMELLKGYLIKESEIKELGKLNNFWT